MENPVREVFDGCARDVSVNYVSKHTASGVAFYRKCCRFVVDLHFPRIMPSSLNNSRAGWPPDKSRVIRFNGLRSGAGVASDKMSPSPSARSREA